MTPNLLTLFRQIYVSLYWHLFGQILSLALIALHLQYIGSGPAAVPVELPDQLLHLGKAEVGDDHQVAAGKFFLLLRSVLRPLSTRASCSYDASKEVKNLPAAIPVQP